MRKPVTPDHWNKLIAETDRLTARLAEVEAERDRWREAAQAATPGGRAREVIARTRDPGAFDEADVGYNWLHTCNRRAVAFEETDAILAALEAEGLVVVPVEPTEAMCKAGSPFIVRDVQHPSAIGMAYAEASYRAMTAAAKESRHDEH